MLASGACAVARAVTVAAATLFIASCGYVGPVLPPSPMLPDAVTNLAAIERGDQIVITFDTPIRTTDNLTIKRFSDIDLRIGVAKTPFDFNQWAAGAQQYRLPPPPANDRDNPQAAHITKSIPAADWTGKRVAIAVRTAIKKTDHYSSWSNRVVLNVIAPLEPPVVKVEPTAEGILLTWAEQHGAEYVVFRQGPGDHEPVQIGISAQPKYVDSKAQYDTPYTYTVLAKEGSAESLLSQPERITMTDIYPPSVPSGITALAAPDSVQVSWQRSPEPDLKGYYVYRSVDGGPYERQGGLVSVPTFSDRNVQRGKTYAYEVSAIDQKGNESARSKPAEVAF